MRCLGIDYGEKRIGLSFGLGANFLLGRKSRGRFEVRQQRLASLIRDRRITDLVLGHPLNMDDTAGFKAKEAEAYAARLRKDFGLPVHLVDERLTSYEAEQAIPKHKRRALRATGLIDSRAACLILQDFLNQRFPLAPAGEA